MFDWVCELRGATVERICRIPSLQLNTQNNYYALLFALNDRLHFCNNKEVFVLENEKPKQVFKCPSDWSDQPHFTSFCNNAFIFNRQKFMKINPDFTTTLVTDKVRDNPDFCFSQGGVAAFSYRNTLVIDLINLTAFEHYAQVFDERDVVK